jgi:hypothetical protein
MMFDWRECYLFGPIVLGMGDYWSGEWCRRCAGHATVVEIREEGKDKGEGFKF